MKRNRKRGLSWALALAMLAQNGAVSTLAADQFLSSDTVVEQDAAFEAASEPEQQDVSRISGEVAVSVNQTAVQEVHEDGTHYYVDYKVVVENLSTENMADGINIKAVLPYGVFLTAERSYTLDYSFDEETQEISWQNQAIPAGEKQEYIFSVEITPGITDLKALETIWMVNDTEIPEEWTVGSDEVLSGNMLEDNSDEGTGESSDSDSGQNNTTDTLPPEGTDGGFEDGEGTSDGDITDGENPDGENPDEDKDIAPETVLHYNGNGYSASLWILEDGLEFPPDLSLQAYPVDEEKASELLASMDADTGVFYEVVLNDGYTSFNPPLGVGIDLTFDTPVLAGAENIRGYSSVNGSANVLTSESGVTGVNLSMTTERPGIIGVAGTMPQADEPEDGEETTTPDGPTEPDEPTEPDGPTKPDEPSEPDGPSEPDKPIEPDKPSGGEEDVPPVEGEKSYTGTDDTGKVKVTLNVTGAELPDEADTLSVQKAELTPAMKESLQIPSDAKIWFAEVYNIALPALSESDGEENGEIQPAEAAFSAAELFEAPVVNSVTDVPEGAAAAAVASADVTFDFSNAGVGTESGAREKTAVYKTFYIDGSNQLTETGTITRTGMDNTGLASVSYTGTAGSGTYGVVAYRRKPENIDITKNIDEASLQYRENAQSEWKAIPTDGAIPANSEIKVSAQYVMDRPLVLGDILYYPLPDGLTVGTGQTGDIQGDNGKKIGTYAIEDNKVVLQFDDTFYDSDGIANDVKGKFSFSGSLSKVSTGDGTETIVINIGNVDLTVPVQQIPVEDKNSIAIAKSVVDNLGQGGSSGVQVERFGDELIYTLKVTTGEENTKLFDNIVITDLFRNTDIVPNLVEGLDTAWKGTLGDGSSIGTEFHECDAKGIYWCYTSSDISLPVPVPTTAPSEGTGDMVPITRGITGITYTTKTVTNSGKTGTILDKITPTGNMGPGDELIIKYAVKINENILKHSPDDKDLNYVKYTLYNKAEITAGEGYTAWSDSTYIYEKTWLKKEVKNIDKDTIEYSVTANTKPVLNLKDWVFTDVLGKAGEDDGQRYNTIKVEYLNPSDNTVQGTSVWKAQPDAGTTNDTKFTVINTYTAASDSTKEQRPQFEWTAPDGEYIYRFTYTVDLTKDGHESDYQQLFHNTINLKDKSGNHWFDTPDNGGGTEGGVAYNRFELSKKKTKVDIANNTISWHANIHEKYASDLGIIPAGSVYTDKIPVNNKLHYMTKEQYNSIKITGHKGTSKSDKELVDLKLGTDYSIEPIIDDYGDTMGFIVTFIGEDIKTDVDIYYDTTTYFPGEPVIDFKNTATYKINDEYWEKMENYVYSFDKLLSKERTTYDNATKLMTWNLTINSGNDTAITVPAGTKITDIIPSGLEFVSAQSKTSPYSIEVDTTNPRRPVFTLKQDVTGKMVIEVVTRVTDTLDNNESKTYTNKAVLNIKGTDYGTAESTTTIGYKVLDKIGQFNKYGFVNYKLTINEAKETLLPPGTDAPANPIFIEDHLGDNMVLDRDTLVVTVNGKPYTDYQIIKGTADNDFIIKNLPDESSIVIEYEVSLKDPLGPTTIRNTADLWCSSKKVTETEDKQNVEIKESEASAESSANIYLLKTDKEFNSLPGAEFEYGEAEYKADTGFELKAPTKEGLTTGSDGKIHIEGLEFEKIYYLRETNPPRGYKLDSTPHFFMVVKREVPENIPEGVEIIRSGRTYQLFNDKYAAETETTLVATKKMNNGALEDGQFEFVIQAQNEAPLQDLAGNPAVERTLTNGGNGRIIVGPIKYTYEDLKGAAEKTFTYKIKEVIPEGAVEKDGKTVYNGVVYDKKEYTIAITVKDNNDKTLTVTERLVDNKPYTDESIHFENTYDSQTSFKFLGTKSLQGKVLAEHMFGFVISGEGIEQKVFNGKDGSIDFPLITIRNTDFGSETEKEFNYVIKEEKSGQNDQGIQYSNDVYNAKVNAKLDKETGDISLEVSVSKNGGAYEAVTGESGVYRLSGTEPTFINVYGASGSILVKGKKVLENKALTAGAYSFKLEPVNDAPVRIKTETGYDTKTILTQANEADGSFQFPAMYYELEDLGGAAVKSFTYQISEALPDGVDKTNNTKDGITYDTKVRTLIVTVQNKGNGELAVTAKLNDAVYPVTGDESLLTFTNKYDAAGEIVFEGQKTVKGHDLAEKSFVFELYDITNVPVTEPELLDSVANDEDGHYAFKAIKFGLDSVKDKTEEERTRIYKIKERNDSKPGYTYDETEYTVTVLLSEENGKILTTVQKIEENGEERTDVTDKNSFSYDFTNTYYAEGSFVPDVTKRVLPDSRDQELKKGMFKFNLERVKLEDSTGFPTDADALENLVFEPVQKEVSCNADGEVSFDEITYKKYEGDRNGDGEEEKVDDTGKYVYKITEVQNNLAGYIYHQGAIYAFVTVTDNNKGELTKTVSYKEVTVKVSAEDKNETEEKVLSDVEKAVFKNTYLGEGTLPLSAVKSLEGRKLEKDQFKFKLEVSDKLDGTYKPVQLDGKDVIVTNAADGTVAFPELQFKHASGDPDIYDIGTYYFRISEVREAKDPDGYTYSEEVYTVKVVVEDAEDGSKDLVITPTIVSGNSEHEYAPNAMVFHNKYEAKGTLPLHALKKFTGSPLAKGVFTFELLDQDMKVLQTVTNEADGSVNFEDLKYDQELIKETGTAVKTYYIREKTTDKLEGVTYDGTLYKLTATIKDKGDGTLDILREIKVVSGGTETSADAIEFTNSFEGSASIVKTKEDGKTALSGAVFELYAAKENGAGYKLYGTYTSDVNGRISVKGLPANKYYFVETKAPEGYLIPKDEGGDSVKYSFVIGLTEGAGEVEHAVVDYSTTVINGKGYGIVELTKYDSANGGSVLEGAEFALYQADGTAVGVKKNQRGSYTLSLNAAENTELTLVTGSNGKIVIDGLPWGSYYFKETKAPDGFVLTDTKVSFVIDEKAFDKKGEPVTVGVKAYNKKTSVSIEKVDENGNGLAGAEMAVRDPETGRVIESWVSNGKAHVIEGKLVIGKTYYLAELKAPEGYEIAPEQEFTVPAEGEIKVTMTDKKSEGKKGNLSVTKKLSLIDENMDIVEAFVKDYTTYIGIFTDAEGLHPYGGDYIRTVEIHNGSSATVTFTELPKGTYYIFETDANGTPIHYDELEEDGYGIFICTVEDGDGSVTLGSGNAGIVLNNVYYDFPDGFYYNGRIDISKRVLKNGSAVDVDETFYAGVFTKDEDGVYVLMEDMIFALKNNGTISVDVPLGGEDGTEPITYYVMETDAEGNLIDKDVFEYEVSGEGTVRLDKENNSGSITITNALNEQKVTPTPPAEITNTPSRPSTGGGGGGTPVVHTESKKVVGIKTGDNTPIELYVLLLAAAALALTGTAFARKRKNK